VGGGVPPRPRRARGPAAPASEGRGAPPPPGRALAGAPPRRRHPAGPAGRCPRGRRTRMRLRYPCELCTQCQRRQGASHRPIMHSGIAQREFEIMTHVF
jgi:hypothetical protein